MLNLNMLKFISRQNCILQYYKNAVKLNLDCDSTTAWSIYYYHHCHLAFYTRLFDTAVINYNVTFIAFPEKNK